MQPVLVCVRSVCFCHVSHTIYTILSSVIIILILLLLGKDPDRPRAGFGVFHPEPVSVV